MVDSNHIRLKKEEKYIEIWGAREHNLKNIDLKIPRNQMVVITGISGSGKSSLAFDTIYAEGQRRYLESYSAYIRQFIGGVERPDVEQINGLSPVISIEQKTTNKNPRSTVGTVTEIYDFMRLLFARASDAYSMATGKKMVRLSEDQIRKRIEKKFNGRKAILLAPLVRGRKGHYRELFTQIRKQGFLKARVDGDILDVDTGLMLDRYKVHDIEVVVDRLKIGDGDDVRLRQSLNKALKLGNDMVMVLDPDTEEIFPFSRKLMCVDTGISYEEPSPNHFSFNSPYGACPKCKGLGVTPEVNMEAVIPDSSITINSGGIAPLGEYRDNYIFKQVRKIARQFEFTLGTSVADIPQSALNLILYGSPEQQDDTTIDYSEKDERWYTLEMGGVVGMLQRCYTNTSSDSIRKWAEDFMEQKSCEECGGARLKKESLYFKIGDKHISELSQMSIERLYDWMGGVEENMTQRQRKIATDVLKEIRARLKFLLDVGLGYLSLDRQAKTLSGGESQRIRLATQIGSELMGITYVLDEPSIGLHQRDNQMLIESLKSLTRQKNSVLVVEHDKDIMLAADYLVDLGPGAGDEGGEVVAQGEPSDFKHLDSLTAHYLNGDAEIHLPEVRRPGNGHFLHLKGASGNNLKVVDISIPLGLMVAVTGVSGSGKSSLINETIYPILNHHFYRARKKPLTYETIEGLQHIDKVIEIDQSPIGRTPRSNPATYTGMFTDIRSLFAKVPEAMIRGYKPGRFSFNVKGGRCETCQGGGMRVVEMNFLPDVYVECEQCLGKRYNRETLEIRYKGKSISDVLEMRVDEGLEFFANHPKILRKLKTLHEVGLGYIKIGQPSPTLSGGEAQRIKLSAELSKRDTGNTFYILDEPTTGLHFEDIKALLKVLNLLVEKGNTVVIIEHSMDVVKFVDHIIDLGPEGGEYGGEIVVTGTPEEVSRNEKSHTGHFLKKELDTTKAETVR